VKLLVNEWKKPEFTGKLRGEDNVHDRGQHLLENNSKIM